MNKKKRFSVLALTAVSCLALCSCGSSQYGKIHDVKLTDNDAPVCHKEGTSDFSPAGDGLGYSFSFENNGRAMISIPYPEKWEVSKTTDYDIAFTAPENDPVFPNATIWFHSTLQGEQVMNADDIVKHFTSAISEDRFTCNGSKITLLPVSQSEKFVVNSKASRPELNLQLSYRDWDASVMKNGSVSSASEFYHQTTSFYWKTFPCILTGLCINEKADKLNDLLIYIMSHSVAIDDQVSSKERVSVFSGDDEITFPVCSLYTQKDFRDYVRFSCPADSGTGYSQSSLFVFRKDDVPEMDEYSFERDYLPVILSSAVGRVKTTGSMQVDDGYVLFGDVKAPEYIYGFSVDDSGNLPRGTFAGQNWEADIYLLQRKSCCYVVCLIAPYDGQAWAFDCIRLMADGIRFH